MTSMEHMLMKAVSTADTANSFAAVFESRPADLRRCATGFPHIKHKECRHGKNSSGTAEKLAADGCAARAKAGCRPRPAVMRRFFRQ
jgi:hypothetical protein